MAVHSCFPVILELLLTYENEQSEKLSEVRHALRHVLDKDGWTLAHLAASKESHVCFFYLFKLK